MTSLITPILIALRNDVKEIYYDIRVIMAPVTLAWALLLLVVFLNYRTVNKSK